MNWLLLPAYEEALNLPALLADVARVRADPALASGLRVVVVDDGSRDGTAEAARAVPGLDLEVLVHARNQGLGAAMRTGLAHILQRAAPADLVFTMDADHTHPPELMPRMAAAAAAAPLVIASRFVPGARVHGLDVVRRAVSRAASWLLRFLFPGARDYTCGYRCYRADLLAWGAQRYGKDFLNQRGFSVMVDLLLKLRRRARRVAEVPLELRYDRKRGASKMKLVRTAWTTLRLLARRFVGDPRGPA